jgi:hypothetical protein
MNELNVHKWCHWFNGRIDRRSQRSVIWMSRILNTGCVTVPKILLDLIVEFLGNQQSVTMQQLCF